MTIGIQSEPAPIMVMPPVFKRTSLSTLFVQSPEISLKKGKVIFSGHNGHQHVYLVTKGMVKLYSYHDGKEMMEDYFLKGELINCHIFSTNERTDLVAETMSQSTCIRKLPVQSFRQAIEHDPLLYKEILTSISNSLERTQERLRRLTLLDSRKRIIHFLLSHTKKAGRRVGYEFVIKPAITHKEMGTIAGTSRQTATTVLNELRSKGIIHFNRSYIIVRNLEALEAVAGIKS